MARNLEQYQRITQQSNGFNGVGFIGKALLCNLSFVPTFRLKMNGEKTKNFWNGAITSKKRPLRLKVRNISGDESIVEIN